MFKKNFFYFIILILFCNNATHCKKTINEAIFYKKGSIKPVLVLVNQHSKEEIRNAKHFNDNFKLLTGEELQTKSITQSQTAVFTIQTVVSEDESLLTESAFSLCFTAGKNLVIKGKSNLAIGFGIDYFFKKYTTLNRLLANELPQSITVPYEAIDVQNPDFEYREPYFFPNMDYTNSLWNHTNQLENKWALWGHNLEKVIPKEIRTDALYAKINGQTNSEQLCFSSELLSNFLTTFVKNKLEEDLNINFFNVSPLDNDLVCMCEKCAAAGNKPNNSSPAVFKLMNKLAKKYPKATFFSNAYLSTEKPPAFVLEKNTGVLISTINYANAVPFKNSKNESKITNLVHSWKKVTNRIYIWDYAVNFDNYLDLYPTLKISQENLIFYKELGVSGVFMHGSEYDYTSFDELKHIIFSKLLWNTQTNVAVEIKKYFDSYLPTIAKEATEYYLFCENEALQNPRNQSIYSGINGATKKYLSIPKFFEFYKVVSAKKDQLKDFERSRYNQLMLSLTYLKLELMRTHPFESFGYASYSKSTIVVDPSIKTTLNAFKILSETTKINILDEQQNTIEDYLNQWNSQIINSPKQTVFLNKPFTITTELDEDYQNIKVLNDGCFGFKKYNTNWFINSKAVLNIAIETKNIGQVSELILNFLNDRKHRIYLANKIEILADNKIITTKNITAIESLEKSIQNIRIPFIIAKNVSKIEIKITNTTPRTSIAIDEIILQ